MIKLLFYKAVIKKIRFIVSWEDSKYVTKARLIFTIIHLYNSIHRDTNYLTKINVKGSKIYYIINM